MNIRSGGLSERNTFWMSVLFHLLLLAIYLLYLMKHESDARPEPEKKPALFVPTYTYSPPAPVTPPTTQAQPTPQQQSETDTSQDHSKHSTKAQPVVNQKDSDFDLSQAYTKQQKAKTEPVDPTEMSLSSFNPATSYRREEPVHMIGEKLVDDPLKKLLGIAISRHLYYPEAAQQLNMHGVVSVGFTLFPDGSIMNAQVMETSKERVLDAAAIAAIKEMGPVANVDIYVKKPRFLVVNIIFR